MTSAGPPGKPGPQCCPPGRDRGNWIFFQLQRFLQLDWLVPARPLDAAAGEYEQLRLADGADPARVAWPDLGYAGAYL